MEKKIQKLFFCLKIIAFEWVSSNTRFYWERIVSSGINMLTNTLKITDTTKAEILELIFLQSD